MKDLQMLSKMKSINKKEDDSESSSFERKFHIKNRNANYRLKIRQNSILNKKHHFLGGVSFFLVGRDGFEPSKTKSTDLQSVAFGRSATYPQKKWSW